MNLNPWSIVTEIFKPAAELVDALHTSKEEKMLIEAKMMEIKSQSALKFLEYESALLEAQADVITSEAKGESWLQRSWRPMVMIYLMVLVTFDLFGFAEHRLSEQAWLMIQLGLGGYIGSRTIEKSVKAYRSRLDK